MDARIALDLKLKENDAPFLRRLKKLPQPPITAESVVSVLESSISLIIPTFQNTLLKANSLQYVLRGVSDSKAIAEIIITVPENETNPSRRVKERTEGKPLRIVRSPSNQRAAARNLGAAQAKSKYLLFLDDDMVLRSWRSIDAILAEMVRTSSACALFPRRQYLKFPILYHAQALADSLRVWKSGHHDAGILDPIAEGCPYKTMLICLPGCFTLIQRASYHDLGGFSENYTGWGFEDAEFARRATEQLKILNLFRKAEPLLHIDHPVSPYKSEEYRVNYERFARSATATEFDDLCTRIFRGRDWTRRSAVRAQRQNYLAPVRAIGRHLKMRLKSPPLFHNYQELVERRLFECEKPLPEFVLLHGSRANDQHSSEEADYDFLMLFNQGHLQEFFLHQSDGVRMEFEYSDLAKFESIAQRPSYYALSGPLELAKIAQARLLWGKGSPWSNWRGRLLKHAVAEGQVYWSVLALGVLLSEKKFGAYGARYLSALRTLLPYAATSWPDPASDLGPFASRLTHALDTSHPGWRMDLKRGVKVFSDQVPEIWLALHWLLIR